jgi:hypothetical protein
MSVQSQHSKTGIHPHSVPSFSAATGGALDPQVALDQMRGMLANIVLAAHALASTLGTESPDSRPVFLTSAQFAERFGGIKAKTVEQWCRDGDFPHALDRGKSGWRIPEFYLYSNRPPAYCRKWFDTGGGEHQAGDVSADVEASARRVVHSKKKLLAASVAVSEGGAVESKTAEAASAVSSEPGSVRTTSDGFDVASILGFRQLAAAPGRDATGTTNAPGATSEGSHARLPAPRGTVRPRVRHDSSAQADV